MARPGLDRHPKFRRLVAMLGIPKPHALGHLECLWLPSYETGDPVIGDPSDVELAAEWAGEPGKLFNALLKCGDSLKRAGFIEKVPGASKLYQIHDLKDHAPGYVESRRQKEEERRRPKECQHCGGEFRSADSRQRFCSGACRTASHRNAGCNAVTDRSVTVTDCNAAPSTLSQHPLPAPSPRPPIPQTPEGAAAGLSSDSGGGPAAPAELTQQQREAAAELAAHDVQIAEQLVREFPDLTPETVRDLARKADGDGGRLVSRIRNRKLLKHRKAPPAKPPTAPTRAAYRTAGGEIPKPLSAEEIRAAVREANPDFAAKLEKSKGATP